jgi:hypothetical protein
VRRGERMQYGVGEGKTAQFNAVKIRFDGFGALSGVENGIAEFGDYHCDLLQFHLCHHPECSSISL